MELKITVA